MNNIWNVSLEEAPLINAITNILHRCEEADTENVSKEELIEVLESIKEEARRVLG